jgi:hypothetical protein
MLRQLWHHLRNADQQVELSAAAPARAAAPAAGAAPAAPSPPGVVSATQWAQFCELGYFIAHDAIEPCLFDELQAAGFRVRDRIRARTLTHGYHQRSPGAAVDEDEWEPWCVRGVYSPQFGEPAFAQWYGSDSLLRYTTSLMACGRDELLLGDSALFMQPRDADFSAGWHADYVVGVGAEAEARAWAEQPVWEESERTPATRRVLQYHLALLPSHFFEVVPGSHRRPLEPAERALLPAVHLGDYAHRESRRSPPSGEPSVMPGGVPMALEAGECLFFDGGLLHNGYMRHDQERLELHCHSQAIDNTGVGARAPATVPEEVEQRRCRPQSYWLTNPAVRDYLPSTELQGMWERWMRESADGLPSEVAEMNAQPYRPGSKGGPEHDFGRAHSLPSGAEWPAHHALYPTLAERLRFGLHAAPSPSYRDEQRAER